MNNTVLRPASAMIELIFALVVMGIVLMSAPQLIATAAQSGFLVIQQEAINVAASQVNMMMGYHWDENDADERFLDPILKTTSGTTELAELNTTADPNTGRRPGTPRESYRTFIRADGRRLDASLPAFFGDAADSDAFKDDIDDFSGTTVHLVLIESALLRDNVETTTIDIDTTVVYGTDNVIGGYNQADIVFNPFTAVGGTTTSSVKSIFVTLTSTSSEAELNEKSITLRAFSCNIGGYTLEEKDF